MAIEEAILAEEGHLNLNLGSGELSFSEAKSGGTDDAVGLGQNQVLVISARSLQ